MIAGLALFALVLAGPIAVASSESPVGVLKNTEIWDTYKSRFVNEQGRVVDNVNDEISHSEGQGYGMVLALAANDRLAFARLFRFAQERLAIRDDHLFAWRYHPAHSPAVKDLNNASDGDLLIAWALLEAERAGWGAPYGRAGRLILADLKPLIYDIPGFGKVLIPGEVGFVDSNGNITLNPAYFVYPALERLTPLTSDPVWAEVAQSGLRMQTLFANAYGGLVPDWLTYYSSEGGAGLSRKMSAAFGYEAIRVPLYNLWALGGDKQLAIRMINAATGRGAQRPHLVDLASGEREDAFADPGYSAIAALAICARTGRNLPKNVKIQIDGTYYPATLQMLALIAAQMRYPQCM